MPDVWTLDPAELDRYAAGVVDTYGSAFAEPPYDRAESDAQRFRSVLQTHRERKGFVIAVAEDEGEGAGFAYGYQGGPGEWWHDRVAGGVGAAARARWLGPGHLEIVELAVRPQRRRAGLGGALLDAVIEAGGCPRAVLSTRVDAPAYDFYGRRGWQEIGRLRFGDRGALY